MGITFIFGISTPVAWVPRVERVPLGVRTYWLLFDFLFIWSDYVDFRAADMTKWIRTDLDRSEEKRITFYDTHYWAVVDGELRPVLNQDSDDG